MVNITDKNEKIQVQTGMVWLVGAGPGDAGLLTVKGARVLKEAQTVIYDALAGEGVLRQIPVNAVQINAGKRGGCHTKPQEEINMILVEEAKKGRRVVRLKGGDPFVFGRGGEEALALKRHGIPFEIIPGVTSAVAVPAYCGIPVTHRGISASFHVITGHFKNGEPSGTDYEALVRTKGTLIFLMGLSEAETICSGLINAGMSSATPAALLQEGTTAGQKKVISTLKELVKDGKKAGIKAPAIIVVGEVCTLEEDLSWSELRPLSGKRVLVTRPGRRAGRLTALLQQSGAEAVEFPVIETRLLSESPGLEAAVNNISRYDWLAFTSPGGVEHFFEYLKIKKLDIRILAGVKLAVIGRATEEALQSAGMYCDYMPERYYAAELGKGLAARMKKEEKILLLRAKQASEDLLKALDSAKISYSDTALYETVRSSADPARDRTEQMLKEKQFHYVTFTSVSTVEGFMQTFLPDKETLNGFTAVCIGEETAKCVRAMGMNYIISRIPDMQSMVDAMRENRF